MSKTAHTPGPWLVWDGQRQRVGPSSNCTVADLYHPPIGSSEANARLIAPAPEMLVALQELTRDDDHFDDFLEALAWARAVVAKAKGAA